MSTLSLSGSQPRDAVLGERLRVRQPWSAEYTSEGRLGGPVYSGVLS